MDGKPLYRKMVDFGALPNASAKSISHGIKNVGYIQINLGLSSWNSIEGSLESTNTTTTYAFVYRGFDFSLSVNRNTLTIRCASSDGPTYRAYICVEYTKTTD